MLKETVRKMKAKRDGFTFYRLDEKQLNEGFESHVNQVVADANPELEGTYHWDNGAIYINEPGVGHEIADAINDSSEIYAHAEYDEVSNTIRFAPTDRHYGMEEEEQAWTKGLEAGDRVRTSKSGYKGTVKSVSGKTATVQFDGAPFEEDVPLSDLTNINIEPRRKGVEQEEAMRCPHCDKMMSGPGMMRRHKMMHGDENCEYGMYGMEQEESDLDQLRNSPRKGPHKVERDTNKYEIHSVDTGKTTYMKGHEAEDYFGKSEWKEILGGYAPHIVAMQVEDEEVDPELEKELAARQERIRKEREFSRAGRGSEMRRSRRMMRRPSPTGLSTFKVGTEQEETTQEFIEKERMQRKLRQARRSKARRRARDEAMRDVGMKKVRGNLGGTYWESKQLPTFKQFISEQNKKL